MKATFGFIALLALLSCSEGKKEVERILDFELEIRNAPQVSSYRGISVLSEKIAWLSGAKGSIVRTVNGGKSWILINPPDPDSLDFRDVQAFSGQEALVMSAGFPSRIYRTQNAGATWTLVHENKDSAAFMNSIHFINETEGFVFGDVLHGYHLLLKTADRGQTWTRVDSNSMPRPLGMENGFAASGSCLSNHPDKGLVLALGGEQVRVFHSADGLDWSAYGTPMYAGSSSRGAYSVADGGEYFMAVGGDYLEVDSARYPIRSKDGKSWEKTSGKLSGYRSVVAYSGPLDLWLAGGSNGLEFSTDSGDTWNPLAEESMNTLQFAPNSSIAFGANGKGELFRITFKAVSVN